MPKGTIETKDVQLQVSEILPNQNVPEHYHLRQTEIIYITSGSATFYIDDKTILLETGDILVIQPMEHHAAKNELQEPFRFLTFKLDFQDDDSVWAD